MPRILIVEDEDIIRSAVRKLLEHAGYEVMDAVSVEEAERYEPDSFDLIITDLRLPGAAGTEMINRSAQHTGTDHDQLCQSAICGGLHEDGRSGLHCQALRP